MHQKEGEEEKAKMDWAAKHGGRIYKLICLLVGCCMDIECLFDARLLYVFSSTNDDRIEERELFCQLIQPNKKACFWEPCIETDIIRVY